MLIRYQCVWTGFSGAPGYSTFHANETVITAQAFAEACRAYLQGAATTSVSGDALPATVKITPNSYVELIDELTGNLQGLSALGTIPLVIQGVNTAGYSSSTGQVTQWITSSFLNGRRVRGRTFIVPLSSATFDTDGTLATAYLTKARTAATTFVANGSPVVWHKPEPLVSNGSMWPVVASQVNDKTAMLTSRRD